MKCTNWMYCVWYFTCEWSSY